MISILPRAVAGAPGPLKCMRRSSIIRARNSKSAAAFCRSSNAARAMTGATSAALPRDALLAADRRALHRPRLLMPCTVFSKSAALLDGGPTIRNDDGGRGGAVTVALVSAGLS